MELLHQLPLDSDIASELTWISLALMFMSSLSKLLGVYTISSQLHLCVMLGRCGTIDVGHISARW
jgi:hypothetical protein